MSTPVTDKTDNLTGTGQADTFVVTNAGDLSSADTIDGGAQQYTSRLGDVIAFQIDTGPVAITDSQLTGVSDVETLSLSGKAAYTVTLAAESDAAGIVLVDASALTTDRRFGPHRGDRGRFHQQGLRRQGYRHGRCWR